MEEIVSAPCSCSELILFDWIMVLESVDLSACFFLLVAGSLVYIIVVGKSLSTMSFYVFFFSLFVSMFCWILFRKNILSSEIWCHKSPHLCCRNLPFLPVLKWSAVGVFGSYGRTTNKVTITASYSMSILISHSLCILLFGVVRYKYCILQEQCWLFDVAEVNKKASTVFCIVCRNTIK